MVNTVITMETEIVRTVTFMAQYAFKKHRVSCYNLFLLGKAKPARYLTLQEDHNVSIYDLFYFGLIGPKYGNQLQGLPKR